MNRLSREKRALVLRCLTDGMGVNATERTTGVAKTTILRLLLKAGEVCGDYHHKVMRNLRCRLVQCDEMWGFIYAKEKNAHLVQKAPYAGDIWLWTALDVDSRLFITWRLGDRSGDTAFDLIHDMAQRLAHRVQLSTDGNTAYLEAVEHAFGSNIDYAQLVKQFGTGGPLGQRHDHKYSPSGLTGYMKIPVTGRPNPKDISTSYVERSNLTIRMSMRRYTRLTNAFSKRLEFHAAAVALNFMVYNFCRLHASLEVSPAMEAGVSANLWHMEDVVRLIEQATPAPGPRGPYRKRGVSPRVFQTLP